MRTTVRYKGIKQRSSALAVALSVFASISISVIGVSIARAAEPSIAFLNPSSFAKPTTGDRGIVVSDGTQTSGGEGEPCCHSEEGYRLSAWTSGLPSAHKVFFTAAQRSARGVTEVEIVGDNGGAGDTWEAWWDIPVIFLDGPATITAYAVVADEIVASVSQDVTLQHGQDTETTRLTYPAGPGDPFGTFQPLATAVPSQGAATKQLPVGVVDHHYTTSQDSTRIRVFYTTTAPGQPPQWLSCGSNFAQYRLLDFGTGGTKCVLQDTSHQAQITGIAAVIEDSMKQSGDATSVVPYVQDPRTFEVTQAGDLKVEKNPTSGAFPCSKKVVVKLTDQVGRKIASANVDVRAEGPGDDLKFSNNTVFTEGKPPDRIPNRKEEAYDCVDSDGNSAPYIQGEIQKLGGPDLKLLESEDSGTSSKGLWDFAFHSHTAGATRWTAWVDEIDDGCRINDDRFTHGELFLNGGVQWASPVTPGPAFVPDTIAPCTSPQPSPSGSPTGEPSPDPSGSPPEPTEPSEPETRSISLEASERRPNKGARITLVGQIDSKTNMCETDKPLKVKIRRPGESFRTLTKTRTSSSARFNVDVRIRGDRDFRAVAIPVEGCLKARSSIVKVRPRR